MIKDNLFPVRGSNVPCHWQKRYATLSNRRRTVDCNMRPIPPFALMDRWLVRCSVPNTARLRLPYDDILDVLRGFLVVVPVDEDWYRSEYPDVVRFLAENRDESATSHFRKFGYFNGRHPFAEGWRGLRRPILFTGLKGGFNVVVTRRGLHIDIERDGFLELVRKLLAAVPVDETWYREHYPEAAEDLRSERVLSASDHYVRKGYFVGFLPFDVVVDDDWYIARYEHVRNGLAVGEAVSAKDHFMRIGYGEGCQPTQRAQP